MFADILPTDVLHAVHTIRARNNETYVAGDGATYQAVVERYRRSKTLRSCREKNLQSFYVNNSVTAWSKVKFASGEWPPSPPAGVEQPRRDARKATEAAAASEAARILAEQRAVTAEELAEKKGEQIVVEEAARVKAEAKTEELRKRFKQGKARSTAEAAKARVETRTQQEKSKKLEEELKRTQEAMKALEKQLKVSRGNEANLQQRLQKIELRFANLLGCLNSLREENQKLKGLSDDAPRSDGTPPQGISPSSRAMKRSLPKPPPVSRNATSASSSAPTLRSPLPTRINMPKPPPVSHVITSTPSKPAAPSTTTLSKPPPSDKAPAIDKTQLRKIEGVVKDSMPKLRPVLEKNTEVVAILLSMLEHHYRRLTAYLAAINAAEDKYSAQADMVGFLRALPQSSDFAASWISSNAATLHENIGEVEAARAKVSTILSPLLSFFPSCVLFSTFRFSLTYSSSQSSGMFKLLCIHRTAG